MSKGSQNMLVDSNYYIAETNLAASAADSAVSPLLDAFRYFSGNFYTAKNGKLVANSQIGFFTVSEDNGTLILSANKSKFIDDTKFLNGILTREYSKDKWSQFITSLSRSVSNSRFEDFHISLDTPLNISELGHSSPAGGSYINREFIYNFHAPEFETLSADPFFDTKTLPSIYSVFTDLRADVRTEKENLELSLGGYIGKSYVDSLSLSNKSEGVADYFQQYSKTYSLQEVRPVINKLKEANTVSVLTDAVLDVTKKLHNKFIPFPYYTSIQFSNPGYQQYGLSKYLKTDDQLLNGLINYIYAQATTPEHNFISEKPVVNEIFSPFYDIKRWISAATNSYKSESDAPDATPGVYLRYANLAAYIKSNIAPKVRKYSELKNSAYNEVLLYKITKHQYSFETTPLQTWIVAPTNSSNVQLYDTQIKYGTEYFYKITAFVLVVGNVYEYQDTYYGENNIKKLEDLENGIYKFNYKNTASYRFIEIPYAKISGAVHESPQTKPIASFDVSDGLVSIRLGEPELMTLEQFEPIENGDIEIFETIRKSQDNEQPDKIYSFAGSQNADRRLEIYKLSQKPTSYSSYQGKLFKSLILKPGVNIVYENILSNRPYYYLFRYINSHGVPSNVSTISKVTLVDEDGYRYLQVEPLDLNPEYPRSQIKTFKKYLLIRPATLQLLPANDIMPENVDDIILGPDDEKVWNKQFLLKIRSKKSGRVLNYRFGVNLGKRN